MQRWNHDWAAEVWLITDEPQSQPMTAIWAMALVAAVARTQKLRRGVVVVLSVLAVGTWLYTLLWKGSLTYPSRWAVGLIPTALGLLLPAAILVWQRQRLREHRRLSLVGALAGPAIVGLAIAATASSVTNAIAFPAYSALIATAVVFALADPRLAVATAVAVLPMAALRVGQAISDPVSPGLDVGTANLGDVLLGVTPVVLVVVMSWLGLRRWSKLTAS